MGIYLGLIGGIGLVSLLVKAGIRDRKQQERVILGVGMMAVFLLLSLKGTSVGRDIPGYAREYRTAGEMPWADFSYVYFEKGFLLLMKLFSKGGLPFQAFAAGIYGVLCLGYGKLMCRYSENVTLSLIILICYQFLVFHISGLRQTLAMAVCLWAFLLWPRSRRLALGLTALAVTFHTSALVFFGVWLLVLRGEQKLSWPELALMALAAVTARPGVWALTDRFLRELEPAGIQVGGNCLFLGGMALVLSYSHRVFGGSGFFPRMAGAAFCVDLMLSGSTLLRGNLFYTLFLIPGIPNALGKFPPRTRLVLEVGMAVFLVLLFTVQTLAVNQLDLLPYRFFWQ